MKAWVHKKELNWMTFNDDGEEEYLVLLIGRHPRTPRTQALRVAGTGRSLDLARAAALVRWSHVIALLTTSPRGSNADVKANVAK